MRPGMASNTLSIPLLTLTMSTSDPIPTSDPEIAAWLQVVERKVAGLRFGSVQIVVHEGRVTQIESTEKFRLQSRVPVEPRVKEDE